MKKTKLTLFISIISIIFSTVSCGSSGSNNNSTNNSSNNTQPEESDNSNNNSSDNKDSLSNIKITSANTFEFYEFDDKLSYERKTTDYLIQDHVKVKDGKVILATTTNVLGTPSYDKNWLTLIGKNYFSTTDGSTTDYKNQILGLDAWHHIFFDKTNNNKVTLVEEYNEKKLEGLRSNDVINPLDSASMDNIIFPKNASCWVWTKRTFSKDVYLLDLNDPKEQTNITSWVVEWEKQNGLNAKIISQTIDKVGSNNEYTVNVFVINYPNPYEPNKPKEGKIGVVEIDGKLYEGHLATANETIHSLEKNQCEFYNKTAADFIVEKTKAYYNKN